MIDWPLLGIRIVVGALILGLTGLAIFTLHEIYERYIAPREEKIAIAFGMVAAAIIITIVCWLVGTFFIPGEVFR